MKDTVHLNELDINKVGALLADPARAAILIALCGDIALPVTELAERADISPSTTSNHLTKLLEAGWVQVEQHGRHRYYRLSSRQIASLLEQSMSVAPATPALCIESGYIEHQKHDELRFARTCYDHLAGRLGVALTDALVKQGVLEVADKDFRLTDYGKVRLENLGIDVVAASRQRRAFACRCLDWTERRNHVGGALGAAICAKWVGEGWVERCEESRALRLVPLGVSQMAAWGVEWTSEV